MKLKLLSYTSNPELIIAAAAKLCYAGCSIDELFDKLNSENIDFFINNLFDMGHESPFEHVNFVFAVEGVSRILEQQLTRHRIASYSIQSGRYVDRNNAEFYMPADIKNCEEAKDLFNEVIVLAKENYSKIINLLLDNYCDGKSEELKKTNKKRYNKLKKKALENARNIFPNSLETKIIFSMNVRSLFKHRCCNRAQDEIRFMAKEMLKLVQGVAPSLFKNAGPTCKTLGICMENNMQCDEMKNSIPTMNEVKELIKKYYKKGNNTISNNE